MIQDTILQGAALEKRKRDLLDEVAAINTQIHNFHAYLLQESEKSQNLVFPINPNPNQLDMTGSFGAFEIKMMNNYQTITRDALDQLCIDFITTLFPNMDQNELQLFALGQANWMWEHRACESKKCVKRTFLETPKTKKQENPIPEQEKPEKKPKPRRLDIQLPKTLDDFMNLAVVKKLRVE
jgi:hypothetical protein